jgi:hypothetical protein
MVGMDVCQEERPDLTGLEPQPLDLLDNAASAIDEKKAPLHRNEQRRIVPLCRGHRPAGA